MYHGWLKSSLFLSSLLSLSLSSACARTQQAGPAPEAPSLEYGRVRTASQDLADFTVVFEATLQNPTAAPVRVRGAHYQLSSEDEILAEGDADLDVTAAPGGKASFEITVPVHYARDADEIRAFASTKVLPLLLEATLHSDAGEIAFSRAGRVRSPRLPYVDLQDPDAARQRLDAIAAVFRIAVHNDNPFTLKLDGLHYTLSVEGKVLSEDTLGLGEPIPPSSIGVYEVPVDLTEETLPGIGGILKEKNALDYKVEGTLRVQDVEIPVDVSSTIHFTAERE